MMETKKKQIFDHIFEKFMITKSNFVIGQECQRCFWFKYNGFEDPNLKDDQAHSKIKRW